MEKVGKQVRVPLLVLVLHLIGRQSGASFGSQSLGVVMQNPNNYKLRVLAIMANRQVRGQWEYRRKMK